MSQLTFNCRVFGEPQAQPRPRGRVIWAGKKAMVHIYTPPTAKKWKEQCLSAILLAMIPAKTVLPFSGSGWATLTFVMPRPKSHLKKTGGLVKGAPAHMTAKPDLDNLAKAVMDVLTEAHLWKDDAQVVTLSVTKMYEDAVSRPGVHISVIFDDQK